MFGQKINQEKTKQFGMATGGFGSMFGTSVSAFGTSALGFGNTVQASTTALPMSQFNPVPISTTTTSNSSTEKVTEKIPEFKTTQEFLPKLEPPWREVTWTEDERASLMERVTSYSPSCKHVPQARVLLLGPVGSGKSSFISSVQSVFNGRVTNRAMVGCSTSTSFTKKLQPFNIRAQRQGDGHNALVLYDMMGFGDGDLTGPTLHDILTVIKGHAPDAYKFSSDTVLSSETEGFIKRPSLKDRIHCVAFVLDTHKVMYASYSKGISVTFQLLRERICDLGVHQVALLTHVDKICPVTAKDVSNIYKSRLVRETISKAGDLLGMSTSYIVPVKNYSSELDVDVNTDVLLLKAVDHILQYTDLFFQDNAEERAESRKISL